MYIKWTDEDGWVFNNGNLWDPTIRFLNLNNNIQSLFITSDFSIDSHGDTYLAWLGFFDEYPSFGIFIIKNVDGEWRTLNGEKWDSANPKNALVESLGLYSADRYSLKSCDIQISVDRNNNLHLLLSNGESSNRNIQQLENPCLYYFKSDGENWYSIDGQTNESNMKDFGLIHRGSIEKGMLQSYLLLDDQYNPHIIWRGTSIKELDNFNYIKAIKHTNNWNPIHPKKSICKKQLFLLSW